MSSKAFAFPSFCSWLSVLFGSVPRVSLCKELDFRAKELFLDLKQGRDGQGSAEEKARDVSFHTNVLQI